ncbi:sensor domain-containing diguanylate cyclase [Vibrio fluvialis]|nr:sensor domain-containing diguanylate cyclase [Vibrio fluvialis]
MSQTSGKRKSIRVLFFVFILSSIGLIEALNNHQIAYIRDGLQSHAREELSLIRFRLEASILSDIYVANSLSTLVTLRPDSKVRDWNRLANHILREGKHLKVIGLAPNDVISYIFPYDENKAAMGLDYRTVPSQWASIVKARTAKQIFIAGPVNLVQGGRALIVRIPIFTDPPMNQEYWGVCSIVLDWESLFLASGIESFVYSYDFAIRGIDSTGMNGDLFYGKQSTFDNAFAVETVHFPYGSWAIAAAEKHEMLGNVPWYQVNLVRLVGYPVMALLAIAFVVIYRLYRTAHNRAMHDTLTHLPNRRYFMFTMQSFFDHAKKSGKHDSFALLNIDLDKFKLINDTYGHAAGDKVLIACAERLKSVLRGSDVIARIGGDEFLVLLPRMVEEDIKTVVSAIEAALCHTPVIYEGHLIDLHISIGHAIYSADIENIDAMLKLADERMYAVKRRQTHR